jgi:hypothetical protein
MFVTKRPSNQVIPLIYMTTMLDVSMRLVMYAITANQGINTGEKDMFLELSRDKIMTVLELS